MTPNVSKEDMSKALPYIIAVDFDGTLVTDKFPAIGEPIKPVWDKMIEAQKDGCKIVLWTCRDGKNLQDAADFCQVRGFVFDAINENIKEVKNLFDNDTRKVYADEYWDDKAIIMGNGKYA